jgi:hypothetical protein
MTAYPPLECSVIVFRGFLRGRAYSPTAGLKPPAFMRRLADKTGLSVNFSTEQVVRYMQCDVVYSLHVGWIRDIDNGSVLDVVQNRDDHANITGLPDFDNSDDFRKEYMAREMIRIASPHYSRIEAGQRQAVPLL